jgi:hypothetical protein
MAMIGAFWHAVSAREIPARHRVIRDESVRIHVKTRNQRIFDAGLKTQNYDKGFERFVRKFNPETELEATVAIIQEIHHEHGTAILLSPEKPRCLLLDTTYGLEEEEAFWYTLMSWAEFQPRKKSPRQEPGKLYYPPGAPGEFGRTS